jgi:hypothetical protein
MNRIIRTIILIFVITLIFAGKVQASTSFHTEYNINYEIASGGSGRVIQEIKITNLEAHSFASKYSIVVKGKPPRNIRALSDAGDLPVFTSRIEKDSYEITINLTENVVGAGKSQSFSLEYDLDELAVKNGRVWQISIPRTDKGTEIDELNVNISVPLIFGKPNFVSPPVSSTKVVEDKVILGFSNIQEGAISAVFGEFQVYALKLKYHLKNSGERKEIQKIVIPPDTPYQRILLESITPQPINIEADIDGNWTASYSLKPQEKLDIQLLAQAHVYALPQSFPSFSPDPENYLSPTATWPIYDQEIQSLARSLKTPKDIYDFVVETLEYNYDKTKDPNQRLGGKGSLDDPDNAACQEFTDLFISLARASGIPAREINGYGYTNNPKLRPVSEQIDVLHTWPEYYDAQEKTWIQVDPTWADTTGGQNYFDKLDTEHIAFAIHGVDPYSPRPAGDYKTDNSHQKDIEITLGEVKDIPPAALGVSFKLPLSLLSYAWGRGSLVIQNNSQVSVYNLDPILTSEGLDIQNDNVRIDVLPPYGKVKLDPKFKLTRIDLENPPRLSLQIKAQEFHYTLPYVNYYISVFLAPGLAIFTVLTLIIIIYKYVYFRKTKN